MKIKTKLGALLLAFILIFSMTACQTEQPAAAAPAPDQPSAPQAATLSDPVGIVYDGVVKVGVSIPASGAGSYFGGQISNAVTIEAERINAEGGVLGKKIELIIRDDELSPEKALTACREFIELGVDCIVGPAYTTSAVATKDVVTEAKVVQILPNVSGAAALVDAPYSFRLQEAEALRLPELARCVDALGFKRVGVLAVNDSTGEEFYTTMEGFLDTYGIEIAAKEYFRIDDTDLTPAMLKLRQADCEAVIVGTGNATPCAYIATANEALGWNVPLMSGGGFSGYTFPELAGRAAIGAKFVAGYMGYLTKIDYADMPTAYARHVQTSIEKYGWRITDSGIKTIKCSLLAADSLVWWAKAVETAGTFEADAVIKAMESQVIEIDESPSGTRLVGGPDHETYRAGSLFCYQWNKDADDIWYLEEVDLG